MDGFRMRELRRIAGLSQREVAAELGVTGQTVYRWENWKSAISSWNSRLFLDLVHDIERVSWIKKSRPIRVHGRPFVKKGV